MSDSRGRLLEEQNAAYEASVLADQEKVSDEIFEVLLTFNSSGSPTITRRK